MSTRKDLDDKEIVNLYESGLDSIQIASRFKCHYVTILKRLRKNNITHRPQGLKGRGRVAVIIRSLSTEQLQQLVDKHFSMKKLMKEINISSYSRWYHLLKERLRQDGIDFSKFKSHQNLVSDVMVENSKFTRSILRKCIVRNNLLDRNKCSICGLNAMWRGSPLVLILDHINGKSNDHRLGNLRYVCPNCSSQLPTFAGRNGRRGKRKVWK